MYLKTLLYVEDEPLIRQNAVEYLNRYCHKVLEAKDGLEALEVYTTHKPDLIISDNPYFVQMITFIAVLFFKIYKFFDYTSYQISKQDK